MTTEDFIIGLFCWVDDHMKNVPNYHGFVGVRVGITP